MDSANVRFLFSALIQALAAVWVIGFIALLNFPRRASGSIPNTKIYDFYSTYVKKVGIIFFITIFIIIGLLAFLDYFDLLLSVIIAGIISFYAFYMLILFLIDYIDEVKKL